VIRIRIWRPMACVIFSSARIARAPPAATGALWTVWIEGHMAKFAHHALSSLDQLAVAEDPRAHARRHRDDNEVTKLFALTEPNFRQHTDFGPVSPSFVPRIFFCSWQGL
jgi:hypothetical protein